MKKFGLNRTSDEHWKYRANSVDSFIWISIKCRWIFLKNSRKSTTKLLELIKEFHIVAGYKNIHTRHH